MGVVPKPGRTPLSLLPETQNQLAVIDLYLPNEENQALVEEELGGIKESIGAISRHVDSISKESLHAWKRTYPEAVQNTTQIEPIGDSHEEPKVRIPDRV